MKKNLFSKIFLVAAAWLMTLTVFGQINVFPYLEDFEDGVMPSGWSQTTNSTPAWGIRTPTLACNGLNAEMSGDYFMAVCGSGFGFSPSLDVNLYSPVYDFSNYEDIAISFDHRHLCCSSTGRFFYRINGGSWVQLFAQSATTNPNPTNYSSGVISAFDGNEVEFRWQYTASSTSNAGWAIDDVSITATSLLPIPEFVNVGGTDQLVFDNAFKLADEPTFRIKSAFMNPSYDAIQIQIADNPNFTGTVHSQTFTGSYDTDVAYNFECDNLSPAFSPSDNTTYYARARASDDGGTNYGIWTQKTHSFTYKSAGDIEWYQTTSAQLETNNNVQVKVNSGGFLEQDLELNNYGYHTYGTTGSYGTTGGFTFLKVQLNSELIVKTLNVYFGAVGTGNNALFRMALYTDNSNYPGTKIAETAEASGVVGWNFVDLTSSYSAAAGTYWIGIQLRNAANTIRYTNNGSGNVRWGVGTYGTMPASAPGSLNSYGDYSISLSAHAPTINSTTTPIHFDSWQDANEWDEVHWTRSGNTKLQVLYDNGGTPTLVPDGDLSGNSAGFTSSPIDISDLDPSTYSTLYLRAKLEAASDQLSSWRVTTKGGITISQQPTNQTVCDQIPNSTQFSITATGQEEYQWQVSTNSGGNWTDLTDGGVYSGVETATMTITGADVSLNGNWYRVVLSATGLPDETSNHATFGVGEDFCGTEGDYRSKQTGNWNQIATWQRFNGTTWEDASSTPTSADGTITIRDGHTVTVTASVTIDETIIAAGGQVTLSDGTITVANGPGDDLIINGTYRRTSTSTTMSVSGSAMVRCMDGGVYIHNLNGGSVPSITWEDGSVFRLSGTANMTTQPSSFNQSFSIIEIDLPNQTSEMVFNGFGDVREELKIISSGTGAILLNATKSITGGFNQSGGKFIVQKNTAVSTFTIGGQLLLTNGVFVIADANGINNNVTVVVDGNTNFMGGTLTFCSASSSNGRGYIRIRKDFTLQNTTFIGFFIDNSGFYFDGQSEEQSIFIGISASSPLSRFFYNSTAGGPTGLNEIYNGAAPQNTVTGTGGTPGAGWAPWPTSGTLIKNLTIDNAAGVTLSQNKQVNGTLNLVSGNLNVGAHKLTYAGTNVLTDGGKLTAANGELDFANTANLTLPQDVFNGDIKDLTLSGAGGVKVRENITVSGILNLAATNPNSTDGLLDMVNDYGDYATARYSTDTDGRLLDTYNSGVTANTHPSNALDSYTLTMGENATTIGQGDVTGKISRSDFTSGETYDFGNRNMQLTFTEVDGSGLPTNITVVVTRGDQGIHPDKQEADLSFAQNENDTLLGAIHVGRLYQVLRTGGTAPTRFTVRFPYEDSELNGNSEEDLVTWDHHLPYNDGLTPHEHGKTSQNTTENWVELSNHGLFYLSSGTPGAATKYWMLSDQVTEDILWLGAAEGAAADQWNVESNWSSGVIPDAATDIVVKNAVYKTALDIKDGENWIARTMSLDDNSVVHAGDATLTLKGGPIVQDGRASWSNKGTFNAGTSKVIFDFEDAAIDGETEFYDVEIASGEKLTMQNQAVMKISNNFVNEGTFDAISFDNEVHYTGNNQSILTANGGAGGYRKLFIEGTGNTLAGDIEVRDKFELVAGAALNADNKNLVLSCDLENNGTFAPGSGTVEFKGTAAKEVKGTAATNFHKLTMNGTGKVTLLHPCTVQDELILTEGILSLDEEDLTVDGTITGGSGTTYVDFTNTGVLHQRVASTASAVHLPVGSSGTYAPVNLSFASATLDNAYLVVNSIASAPATLNPDNVFRVNRTWRVEPIGITDFTYDIELVYSDGEFNSPGDASSLLPAKYSGGEWYKPTGSDFTTGIEQGTASINTGTNTVTWSGLTTFSDFVIVGEAPNALPVDMVSFTARCNGQLTQLEWVTASEVNSQEFQVERSRDGQTWTSVAVIPAAGTSNDFITYNYEEERAGLRYYRLVQVDFDGEYEIFGPLAVNCEVENNAVSVYPNPSNGDFTIQIESKENLGQTGFSISDATGKLVHQGQMDIKAGTNSVHLSTAFEKGVYLIRIHDQFGAFNIGKVTIN